MNMLNINDELALEERKVALEERRAAARMLNAQARELELQNELLEIEVEEKRAEAKQREADRISASTYAKMGPADVYYAWRALGEPRGLNMAQTLQNAHTMRGGKLSEHAALQWGDVERSGLLEDVRVVERSARAVVLDIKRFNRSPQRISWTIEDAERAGLAGSNTWRQYPSRMLEARAKTEAATLIFADITTGSAGSGANTYSTEEAAFFSGSREDEATLSAIVELPELAPTEEAPSAPPAPAPAPVPAPAPAPDRITSKLVERVRREAREEGVDPELFERFLSDIDVGPPQLPADVHEICEEYLVNRTAFNQWLKERKG